MDIDANINIEIEDSDIVDAVREELAAAISSYDESNPLHDRIDWDSAHRAGLMTFEHTDDEVRSLIREVIELNADVLRPIIAAQVDAAVLYRVQKIVREEITKWGQSFGNVLANMTHDYKGESQ
jgi:hypothetical protein|tara:strand:- start:281 stop:652 length:372 start_codon:yes stop_codon:yes gene_type:complete